MKKTIILLLCLCLAVGLCACSSNVAGSEDTSPHGTYTFSDTEFFTLQRLTWSDEGKLETTEIQIGVGSFVDKLKELVTSLEKTNEVSDSLYSPEEAYILTFDGVTYRFDSRFETAALVTSPNGIGIKLALTQECSEKVRMAFENAPDNTYEGTVKNNKGDIVNPLSVESTVYVMKANFKMTDSVNKISVQYYSTVQQDVVAEVETYATDGTFIAGYVLDPVSLRGGYQTVSFEFKNPADNSAYDLLIVIIAADKTRTSLKLRIEP